MSVSRSIALLTEEELTEACTKSKNYSGEDWFHHCSFKSYFEFGDNNDYSSFPLDEIAALKPKVDDVVALLEFLFLQGSESQQIDMFSRFLAANLGQNKIVHFWSE